MKIMARLHFPAATAICGITTLEQCGFEVRASSFLPEPDYVFVEATRDSSKTGDGCELGCEMLDEVEDLIRQFGGDVSDAGPIPAGAVPFEWDAY